MHSSMLKTASCSSATQKVAVSIICNRWRLQVNTNKTKILIFHKGRLAQNLEFKLGDSVLEIVNRFTYLGLVFTCSGSFSGLHETLAGQARKDSFKLERYVQPFVNLTPIFKCELLIS
jgi:hypothetical protein